MDVRLDGRSAVITGGSKGLGSGDRRGIRRARAPMWRSSRATQAPSPRPSQQIEAGAPGRKVVGDQLRRVEAPPTSARAYDQVMSEFGKIDIFVNNAGQSTRGPLGRADRRDVAGRSRPEAVRRRSASAASSSRR